MSKKLAEAEKEKAALKSENRLYELQLENQYEKKRIEQSDEIERMKETSRLARKEAEKELQALLDAIQKSELARQKEETDAEVEKLTRFNDIDKKKQEAYTTAVTKVIKEISPDLVSALTTKANADMLEVVTEAMGPYAIASNSSVADVTNMLLRGTSLENVLGDAIKAIKSDND